MLSKYANLIGTITAVLAVISGVMSEVLKCTGVDLTAVCTAPWLGKYAAIAGMIFGAIAIFTKAVRPGGILNSFFGSTAVVVPDEKAKPGVVTKSQVASSK